MTPAPDSTLAAERPLISVVIPTLNRPHLLPRALASVFAQTYPNIEVIVVIDGPDRASEAALREIGDERLHVIANPQSLTAAGARNLGVDRARGTWIAFLDDDDEWLPEKLSRQMDCAQGNESVVVTCRSVVVSPGQSVVQPRVTYDNRLPLDEYLFDAVSPRASVGFIQTSSYLIPRKIVAKIRFRTDTPHDDWDFIIRASKEPGLRIETVPEALVKVHVDRSRPSLSASGTWSASLAWIESIRPIASPRAYAGFCLSVAASRAAAQRAYPAFFVLLSHAFRHGAPRPFHVVSFVSLWILPPAIRRQFRAIRES